MDWRAKVELFEQIRRDYEHGEGTIRGVARKMGVHRRMVREALGNALPAKRKRPQRPCPKLGPVKEFIDAILESDRKAPRKERHTAHRIYQRLRAESPGCDVSESTLRRYVGRRKRELGLGTRETFVPQSYAWGWEAQADWYEAAAELDGERCTLQVFSLRSMASGVAFHRAYRRAKQQAFLEAQELAFRYFGGVFRQVRCDNLKSAVKKILQGYQREETARFIAFRSHWGFGAEFCNPGRGNEKGGVEAEVGYFRRNHWTPVPQARSLEELNQFLEAACRQDEARHIQGRERSVGAAMALERDHLLPLPGEGFELVETSFPVVDTKGCVKVRTNWYSAPVRAETAVQVKVQPAAIEVWQEGACVARHERCYERGQQILNLEHYLEVLEKQSHLDYLEALLAAELEERERNTVARRLRDAHLPRMKTLEEFDFSQSPKISAAETRQLAEGGYNERAEPIPLIGDCGTGKTHLMTGLCVAACRQKRRVRFTTTAGLVNELEEAKHQLQLRRVMARWSRYELIAIDEVGYVPLADLGAEFLFQVIAERAEKAAVIMTTNLPFSEWTQVIPNARLCKALLDRVTDQAHIIETGADSYRFRRTLEKRKKKA